MYNSEGIKLLIDEKIYKFLYVLIKSIFLIGHNSKISDKIESITEKIKENFNIQIESENKKEYLKNILKFIKTQNKIYAAEIFENILIIVFSLAFKNDDKENPHKYNTIGKYIFKDLLLLKSTSDLEKWFDDKKLNIDYLNDKSNFFKNLLENDILFDEGKTKENTIKNNIQKEITLYDILYEIKKEKVTVLKSKQNINQKFINYLNGEKNNIYNYEKKDNSGNSVKFENSTSTIITEIMSAKFYSEEIGKSNKTPIGLAKSLLISSFIYYQNKHSPLMKYIEKKDDLVIKPFEYDLKGATISFDYAGIVIPPVRVEPRISKIMLTQNDLREKGIYELAKLLIFNRKIKDIEFNRSGIKSYYLKHLNEGLGIFDNYSIESLNLSLNYLHNDLEPYLCNILSHLKGLKTINLTGNELKDGISSFLIVLKKLYRQKKINLENLILNKCSLDEISFYELGELLKSKNCKLKTLCLNSSNRALNSKFLKKLKKNKSLTEIYFNGSNLDKKNTDDIMRVISNTQIENLYLSKNKFYDFDDCLRILYRTKLVLNKEEEKNKEKIIRDDSILYNLDLSLNVFSSKNTTQIELLKNILEDTTLYCIDLSCILLGKDPNEFFKNILNKLNQDKENDKDQNEKLNSILNDLNDYQKKVIELKKELDKKQKEYKSNMENFYNYKVDKEKCFEELDNEIIQIFKELDEEIFKIIKDENSILPLFLKKKANELIDKNRYFKDKDKNEKEEMKKQLVKYMTYKKALENLKILEKKIDKYKLVLI